MITTSVGSLNISKVIVAEMFGVSRSAVTQTSHRHDNLESDLIQRLYRYMTTKSSIKETLASFANTMSLELLSCLRNVMAKRNVNKTTPGRPRLKVDFTALKKLIRAIVSDISSSNSKIVEEPKSFVKAPIEDQIQQSDIEYEEEDLSFMRHDFCEQYGMKLPESIRDYHESATFVVRKQPDISEYGYERSED
jgi:hypothetical protein